MESGIIIHSNEIGCQMINESITRSFVIPVLDFSSHSSYNIMTLLDDLKIINGEVICIFNSDEVYEKFLYDGAEHISMASFSEMKDRVITINSFSKSYAMTGWRIGYAAGNKQVIKNMTKLQEHIVACVSTISQRAAMEALEGPQGDLKYMLKKYRSRREQLVSGIASIDGINCVKPKGSFYVFANVKELCASSDAFAEDLLQKAMVCVIPGTAFGQQGEGYVRISYTASEDEIETGLERLKSYVVNIR